MTGDLYQSIKAFYFKDNSYDFQYVRGEFIDRDTHGYSDRGITTFANFDDPLSDFTDILNHIDVHGYAVISRPLTNQEKSFLTIKYNHPLLPTNIVDLFYEYKKL